MAIGHELRLKMEFLPFLLQNLGSTTGFLGSYLTSGNKEFTTQGGIHSVLRNKIHLGIPRLQLSLNQQLILAVSYTLSLFFPHFCRSFKFAKDSTDMTKECKKNMYNVVFIKFIHTLKLNIAI